MSAHLEFSLFFFFLGPGERTKNRVPFVLQQYYTQEAMIFKHPFLHDTFTSSSFLVLTFAECFCFSLSSTMYPTNESQMLSKCQAQC